LLAILYFFEGYASHQVAKLLHQSDSTVRRYLHRYNKFGLVGLKDIPHPPKETILTNDELKVVDKALSSSPRDVGLNSSNWTGWLVVSFVKKKFNKTIAISTAYNILHQLSYSKTRPKKTDKRVNKETL
jgi:transposase